MIEVHGVGYIFSASTRRFSIHIYSLHFSFLKESAFEKYSTSFNLLNVFNWILPGTMVSNNRIEKVAIVGVRQDLLVAFPLLTISRPVVTSVAIS